eukprot:358827-Chlamydomonas_euryale.AAC.4
MGCAAGWRIPRASTLEFEFEFECGLGRSWRPGRSAVRGTAPATGTAGNDFEGGANAVISTSTQTPESAAASQLRRHVTEPKT